MESRKNGIDDLICSAEIETHVKNKHMNTTGEEVRKGGRIGKLGLIHITTDTVCKIGN